MVLTRLLISLFQFIFIIVVTAGFSYQTWTISNTYFRYQTSTLVELGPFYMQQQFPPEFDFLQQPIFECESRCYFDFHVDGERDLNPRCCLVVLLTTTLLETHIPISHVDER